MDNKENLFLTKHFLSIIGVFFLTSVSPAIDSAIDGTLTGKDIGHLVNAAIVTVFGASLKALDKNVYTPKGIIGRDKEDTLPISYVEPTAVKQITNVADTITQVVANPVGTVVSQITKDPVINEVASVVDTVTNPLSIVGKSSAGSSQETKTTGLYIKALQKTWLKAQPVDSSTLADNQKLQLEPNEITYIVSYKEPALSHIEIQAGTHTWFAFATHVALYKNGQLVSFSTGCKPTKDQLEVIYNNSVSDALYADFLACLDRFGILTPEDVCQFLGQVGAESGGLVYTKELATGDDYEGRDDLGNTQEGDGKRFKGGGFLQTTGRYSYQRLADYLQDQRVMEGCDYIANNLAFTASGYWWFDNKMSDYINNDHATVEQVSTAVNGTDPANGLSERIMYYAKAREVLGIV